MTNEAPLVAATRAALEATYGLALDGLNEDQLRGAVLGVAADVPADASRPEFLARVVDRLPIDESWLFRDEGLWEWLRGAVGPELLERARELGRKARILSLGCSSGQEAFTAAMVFQSLLEGMGLPPSSGDQYAEVLGIDSSRSRIEAARSGLLSSWSVQRCCSDLLTARVTPEPETGRFVVAPSVRAMCRFDVGNLLDVAARGNAALAGYDLVLCRNVLIYFRAATADRIARDLAHGLDRGAYLAVSASEAHLVAQDGLEPGGFLGAARALRKLGESRGAAGRRPDAPRPLAEASSRNRRAAARASARYRGPERNHALGAPEGPQAIVARHLAEALRHAEAGRRDDALRLARAALLHDPTDLYSRLVLGQQMLELDAKRGREVLRRLLEHASRLPPTEAVTSADGLSVGQLAEAVRILLMRGEGA